MSKFFNAIRMLAKMKALDANSAEKLLNAHVAEQDGGPGSGNFGHKGRPGKRGGSGPGGGKGSSGGSGSKSSSGGSSGSSGKYSFVLYPGAREMIHGKPYKGTKLKEAVPISQEKLERLWDFPTPEESARIDKNIKENREYLKRGLEANKEPEKKNLLQGVMGKIDPKEHPDVFVGGVVPSYKGDKPVGVEVVRGNAGKKYIEITYESGKQERRTPEETRALTAYMSDPDSHVSPNQRRGNRENLVRNKMKTADWCFYEKDKYEEGSEEHKAYSQMAESLAKNTYKRPTVSDSRKMIKDRLSNISPKLQQYAVDRYKKDMSNEPRITQDICDIADELGVQMEGLEFRTKVAGDNDKGVCRIQQKIEQDLEEDRRKAEAEHRKPTLTYNDCVDGLSDLVRYTQMSSEENLVDNFEKTTQLLEQRGYHLVKLKNYYKTDPMENPYRGVNCVYETDDGTRFEVQFHTPRSLASKMAQHGIYEKDRGYDADNPEKSTVTQEEHEKLQERMRNVSVPEKVPLPRGISKLPMKQNYPSKRKRNT